jgi:hypothetical protein
MCQLYSKYTNICSYIISVIYIRICERSFFIQLALCHKEGTNYIFGVTRLGSPEERGCAKVNVGNFIKSGLHSGIETLLQRGEGEESRM